MSDALSTIALIGNPNAGKTTLFNRLCGTKAKTSNFPGTTTAVRTGRSTIGGARRIEVPARRRKGNGHQITVENARANNLKGVTASLPLGTLIANLGGGYLIGIAVGVFQDFPGLSPEWRLLVITGFLGGLTTFSTFSAEAMLLLQRNEYGWAIAHSSVHLIGSIAFCIAGLATWRLATG